MPAIVSDQFRILNAANFVSDVSDSNNSYYVVLGLANPTQVGFGRSSNWDNSTPYPVDDFNYSNHVRDTMLFGKKITKDNIRRLIRRVDWTQGTIYEMYRHDYSIQAPSPVTNSTRLYDANYYVMNSDFQVYICLQNGSSGINTVGNQSLDEPTFTDLEPSKAGNSGDGYVWKYMYTVSPGDIIKFDTLEYIPIPNDWETVTGPVASVRDNGNSDVNLNQIKTVYIEKQGAGYGIGQNQPVDILGDGTGGKAVLSVDSSGKITSATVSSGGSGYSFGIIDLSSINTGSITDRAFLIPIIPPTKGHGFNAYNELGADKVLIYARFDDIGDFPTSTKFAQVGLLKNPLSVGSTSVQSSNSFSSTNAIVLNTISDVTQISVGSKISQTIGTGVTAFGWITSFDNTTNVVRYAQDRSLYFNQSTTNQEDDPFASRQSFIKHDFTSAVANLTIGSASCTINTGFTGINTVSSSGALVDLGINFTSGLSGPEIEVSSGELIYIDNRQTVSRNLRQREDVKIVLEF